MSTPAVRTSDVTSSGRASATIVRASAAMSEARRGDRRHREALAQRQRPRRRRRRCARASAAGPRALQELPDPEHEQQRPATARSGSHAGSPKRRIRRIEAASSLSDPASALARLFRFPPLFRPHRHDDLELLQLARVRRRPGPAVHAQVRPIRLGRDRLLTARQWPCGSGRRTRSCRRRRRGRADPAARRRTA